MTRYEDDARWTGRETGAERKDLHIDVDVVRRRMTLHGGLDNATAPLLAEVYEAVAGDRPGRFTVDLRGLDFLAAAGVTALIRLQDTARRQGGELSVVRAEGIVLRVLIACGVQERLCVRRLTAVP